MRILLHCPRFGPHRQQNHACYDVPMTDQDPLQNAQRQQHERLWTPWRMQYVGGDRPESGCIFCNRLQSNHDRASLILHRAEHAFVIMNLFPYNTGHVMIVPNRHAASPESFDDATLVDMARLVPRTLRALRTALNPAGFNIGTNVGADAGAGIAAHLHQHIVPRWQGDANFMPILANTMVLPELIPVTYAKVRAEFERERSREVAILGVDPIRQALLVSLDCGTPTLPRVPLNDQPIWRTGADYLSSQHVNGVLVGWAGRADTNENGPLALAYELEPSASGLDRSRWIPLSHVAEGLDPADAELVAGAIDQQ